MSKKTTSSKKTAGEKKTANEKKTVGPLHFLSELTERVTRDMRRAAMEKYLMGDLHRQMLIAGELVKQCDTSAEKILKGEIAPHLDICCCDETFAAIMTGVAFIHYKGCDIPEEDCPENEEACDPEEFIKRDMPLDDATFTKLNRLSSATLRERLIADYDCAATEYGQMHEDDDAVQHKYYTAVLNRFKVAAQYAKAIGSESARLWLEAFCLLQRRPNVNTTKAARLGFALDLYEDCVAEAYRVAERAQRMLWVDDALRVIAPAKLAPKKSPKKGR